MVVQSTCAIPESRTDPALDALPDARYAGDYDSSDHHFRHSAARTRYQAYPDTSAGLQELNTRQFRVDVVG